MELVDTDATNGKFAVRFIKKLWKQIKDPEAKRWEGWFYLTQANYELIKEIK